MINKDLKEVLSHQAEMVKIPAKVETMDDYKDELEASFRRIRPGDIVTGTVIDVDESFVTIDFNYYAPARIPVKEMSNDPSFNVLEQVKNGDVLSGTVVRTDDGSGNFLLSVKEATDAMAWGKLKELMERREIIHGKIGGIVPSGVIMYVEGIRGFIPASKLDMHYVEDVTPYLNKEVDAVIINVEEESKKLVLSVKDILVEQAIKEKNERINRIEVGSVVEGTVEELKPYGAFVNIGDNITGLLHISQICEKRLKHPKEMLKVGETVRVKIIKVENNKISLSRKELDDVLNKEVDEGMIEYVEEGTASTGLGSLLAGLKLK